MADCDQAARDLSRFHTILKAEDLTHDHQSPAWPLHLQDELGGCDDSLCLRYLCSDVVKTLLNIACDPWLYEHMHDKPSIMLQYLSEAYSSLSLIGTAMIKVDFDCHPGVKDRAIWLIESSEALWRLLSGKGRETQEVLQDAFILSVDSPHGFRRNITYLSMCVAAFHRGCHGKTADLRSSYLPNVLLKCWIASEGDEIGPHALDQFLFILASSSRDTIHTFIGDNLIHPGYTEQFVRTWFKAVKKPYCDDELGMLFVLLEKVARLGAEDSILSTHMLPSLPVAVADACKRQLCSGSDNVEIHESIFILGISMMCFIFDATIRTAAEACALVNRTSIIPLVREGLQVYATRTWGPSEHERFTMPLTVIPQLLDSFSSHDVTETDVKNRAELRRTLHKYWQPTLDSLRALPRAAYPSRAFVVDEWIKFGRNVNLYERPKERYRNTHDDEHDASEETYRFRRCYDESCLCSGRPGAHPMFVCKGCWTAMYCNQKCQRNHWRTGHRDVCRSFVSTQ